MKLPTPTLKPENIHKTKRETLQEEGSRQLAASLRERRISNFSTENMDEEIAHVAQQLSDDMDALIVDTFEHRSMGRTDLVLHSLATRGHYIEPVDEGRDLPPDMPVGSMCFVHSENQVYIYTGERWVACAVEHGSNGQIVRATVTTHERNR